MIFRRQLERHDMATLTAIGHHKPAELVTVKDRFLNAYGGRGAQSRAAWLARVMQHVEAHKRMVPIPPPEQ